jgi:hypothetical protein
MVQAGSHSRYLGHSSGTLARTVQTVAGHASPQIIMDRYSHLFASNDHRTAMHAIVKRLLADGASTRPKVAAEHQVYAGGQHLGTDDPERIAPSATSRGRTRFRPIPGPLRTLHVS